MQGFLCLLFVLSTLFLKQASALPVLKQASDLPALKQASGLSFENKTPCRFVFYSDFSSNRDPSSVLKTQQFKNVSFFQKELPALYIPEVLENEESLRGMGFPSAYTVGVDEMHRLKTLSKALRERVAHPLKTHIADFANSMEEHIVFFQKAFLNQQNTDTGLKFFRLLIQEARLRKQNRQVTYHWWMRWNMDLMALTDISAVNSIEKFYYHNTNIREKLNQGDVKAFSHHYLRVIEKQLNPNSFKDVIYLPTIKTLGIIAVNRSFMEGVIPLGLSRKMEEINGYPVNPRWFFAHDMEHGQEALKHHLRPRYKKASLLFHTHYKEYVKNLPVEQRQRIEVAYFYFTHENIHSTLSSYLDFKQVSLKLSEVEFGNMSNNYLKKLLPYSVDFYSFKSIENHFKQVAEDFVSMARQINKKAPFIFTP